MPFSDWQPGIDIASPVYLDSGFLIATIVRRDARYAKAARLLGGLFASQAPILLSVVTLSESLWILAKLSYCELFNHPSRAQWNEQIFGRHRASIFASYGSRMSAIHDMVRDWSQAGIRIEVIPANVGDFHNIARAATEYMRTLGLSSGDAVHLATAESQARSFITVDSGFQRAASSSLEIVHISP